jgi:hypothetical protein
MFTIYRLHSDRREIQQVQEATQSTDGWGLEPTHGLFGSPEWWQHIRDGTLPVQHIKGKISRVYMSSMNDWPEFAVLSDAGEESEWSRYANEPEFAAFYTVGRPIEIDYVVQRTRGAPADFQKIPIEIRVDDQYA